MFNALFPKDCQTASLCQPPFSRPCWSLLLCDISQVLSYNTASQTLLLFEKSPCPDHTPRPILSESLNFGRGPRHPFFFFLKFSGDSSDLSNRVQYPKNYVWGFISSENKLKLISCPITSIQDRVQHQPTACLVNKVLLEQSHVDLHVLWLQQQH